ncbi:hypothetical protein BDZ89DRAFT_41990 [Hymenopellis radicata]|nr:hypothetical protein BDZ89DRAFT_41990 [Hymenopellis radicata]
MSSDPPASTPPIQQQSSPHQQCCHCLCICPKPSVDQAEDPNFHWQSDNSTVNDVDSVTESPPLVVHHNTRHSHAKLLRNQHALQRPVPSDPFDYEHKYPPDAKYKEMADRSRVFKTYMDESTKFDFDMVENWRDGLDMLLVFAALFSGVVTTFVVQTSQSLRVDYAQVTATLMLRLIHVQVAISEGASALVAELGHHTDPSDSFQAKSVDLWVNGLWFTSLVLSLTTTLVAVLTKQWINEYMILPTGTPRDRSRIRHFRFIGLQQWHVPLIIGLLPVLMHISLGVFFAGFIIFLCSLSYAMAKALGCVTGLGALAYLISNLLPLFFANCPYKTPLSLYSFRMVSSVRQCLQSWKACRRVQSSVIARSLKDVERAAVTYQAENLDALAVSWMHNTSSNASVQSIAVQSLAGLPPQSIGVVAGADGITAPVSNPDTWRFLDFVSQEDEERPAVIRAIRVHHRFDQPVDRMERMQRGALRFGAFNMLNKEQDRYQFIYDDSPERAIEAVQSSLLQPSGADTTFDVVFWGRLLEASMQSGLDFLNIESSYAP